MSRAGTATDAEAIRLQLERILASRPFLSAQRSQAFLLYVVERSILGLVPKEYEIAVDVFQRSADYDPAIDASVRVEASRLRGRLREYYDEQGKHDPIRIEMPKGGYAAVFTQLEQQPDVEPVSPPAALTGSGSNGQTAPAGGRNGLGAAQVVRAVPPGPEPGAPGRSSRTKGRRQAWLWIGVLAVFSIASAYAIWSALRWEHAGAPIRSLAVLPLQNLSGDPSQNYFAAGITDELTAMLEKDSTMRVVPPASAMQYAGTREPPREIARALGVDGIVEGSVRRSGGKVHMTLRLIQENLQRPSDKPVWTKSYERDPDEAGLLSGEAAMAIAGKTNSVVAGPAPERYVNPEAHDAYLHGRYLWVAGRNNDAGQYFLKAAALQPDYALAWSGVADYYGLGLVTGVMDPREVRKPFESAAEKGVELNPTLAQTHLSLCAALFFSRWDMSGADQECQRAIDLDPRFAEAYHLRAKVLIALNRDREAIASQKKAMELDPFARPWALAYIYLLARQYDAAIAEANQRMESSPHNAGILLVLSAAYRCKRMYAEGLKAREESLAARDDKADAESIQREFERSGRLGVVRWDLDSLQRASQVHYVSPMDLALDYAQLGDRERTLSLLEEAYRQHSPMLLTDLQSDSAYDFLHGSARYRALIEKIGLPRYN